MIIPVHFDTTEYEIVIRSGALARVGELFDLDRKVLIVTDSGVPAQYAQAVADSSSEPFIVTLPMGESTKNIGQFQFLLTKMLNAGFTRNDCVVAVGGGVVGDLSGFAAASYMRGIDFYNIPTTLLSQVDSSIGGKTAIDFGGVKNSVGAFWHPKKVVIDPDTLSTLAPRQISAGLAESVKMAITGDSDLFRLIENSSDITADIPEIITRSLLIKKGVVERDPTEKNERRVLNFGHTVGHAIESLSDGTLLHGECVAVGMLPMLSPSVRPRVKSLLERLSLPTTTDFTSNEMIPLILHDKKKTSDMINTVIVDEVGSYRICALSPDDIVSGIEQSGITKK